MTHQQRINKLFEGVNPEAYSGLAGSRVTPEPTLEVYYPQRQEIQKDVATYTPEEALTAVENLYPSKGLLKGISKAESNMGTHPNTYRPGYHGGMMQVDEIGFQDTQNVKAHPKLAQHYKNIQDKFGIDWGKTQWKDLRNPLHSAIAARLLLLNKPGSIPEDTPGQAKYWKDLYNTKEGKGTVDHFMKVNAPKPVLINY